MKRLLEMTLGCVVAATVAACSGGAASPAPDTSSSPLVTTTGATATATASAASTTTEGPVAPSPSIASTAPAVTSEPTSPTANPLSAEYCAKNQDPGCPAGSFVGPDAIPNPNGDGTWVPCEGTICTNPNHGAGAPESPLVPSDVPVEGTPCEGDGHWVHLTGGNAAHYGTEWLCAHPGG